MIPAGTELAVRQRERGGFSSLDNREGPGTDSEATPDNTCQPAQANGYQQGSTAVPEWGIAEQHRELWTTVQVIPLAPGWVVGYGEDDGSLLIYPCCALLLQEHRATMHSHPSYGSSRTVLEPPFETRVVPTAHEDGYIEAAPDIANYIGLLGPGEDRERLAFWARNDAELRRGGAR